jgi:hypothetical protein
MMADQRARYRRHVTTAPPTPPPDDKDWTWVISRRCPECGFDGSAVTHDAIPAATRSYTGALGETLLRPDATVRPRSTVWSPVEYACHVRDVCRIFTERLALMVDQDDPQFENWDQDETAAEEQYWTQDPVVVARELHGAAEVAAEAFSLVQPAQWDRPGRRSNGSVFTIDTFGRYFLHDLAHHAWDVTHRGPETPPVGG